MAIIREVNGIRPVIGEQCFLADNAVVVGDVVMGNECSVWWGAIVRGDVVVDRRVAVDVDLAVADADMFRIDAMAHFGVAADACLLVIECKSSAKSETADVYESLDAERPKQRIGYRSGRIVAEAQPDRAESSDERARIP